MSVAQDRSVMSYMVEVNCGFTFYIGQEGGVISPANCQFLLSQFVNLESIEGTKNFDTSRVENLS